MIATKRFHSASKHSSKYLHHLRFEPLESRQLLSVTPAAIVGSSALPMAAPEAGNIQLSAIGTEADGKTICFGDWDGTGRSDSPEVLRASTRTARWTPRLARAAKWLWT